MILSIFVKMTVFIKRNLWLKAKHIDDKHSVYYKYNQRNNCLGYLELSRVIR